MVYGVLNTHFDSGYFFCTGLDLFYFFFKKLSLVRILNLEKWFKRLSSLKVLALYLNLQEIYHHPRQEKDKHDLCQQFFLLFKEVVKTERSTSNVVLYIHHHHHVLVFQIKCLKPSILESYTLNYYSEYTQRRLASNGYKCKKLY